MKKASEGEREFSLAETQTFFSCPQRLQLDSMNKIESSFFDHPFADYCRFVFELYCSNPDRDPLDLFLSNRELYRPVGRQNLAWLLKVGIKRFAAMVNLLDLKSMTLVHGPSDVSFKLQGDSFNYRISALMFRNIEDDISFRAVVFSNLKSKHSIEWSYLTCLQHEWLLSVTKERHRGKTTNFYPKLYVLYLDSSFHWHKHTVFRAVRTGYAAAKKSAETFLRLLKHGLFAPMSCPNTQCRYSGLLSKSPVFCSIHVSKELNSSKKDLDIEDSYEP